MDGSLAARKASLVTQSDSIFSSWQQCWIIHQLTQAPALERLCKRQASVMFDKMQSVKYKKEVPTTHFLCLLARNHARAGSASAAVRYSLVQKIRNTQQCL